MAHRTFPGAMLPWMDARELVIGTTNPAKARNCRAALEGAPYVLRDPGELLSAMPVVAEDAESAEENARRKAVAFAAAARLPAVSLDFALYFDGVDDREQPGLNVRRIRGHGSRVGDDELLDHYASLFARHGGEVRGRWEIGMAAATPAGRTAQATVEIRREFVSRPSPVRMAGYPLASLQLIGDRYVSELEAGEEERLSQAVLRMPLRAVVEQILG